MEDLVVAGLLHDVVEDAGGDNRLREIQDMFGPRVAQIVYAATDSMSSDPNNKQDWRPRKEQHIARVRTLAQGPDGQIGDAGACLVIASDKMHNLSSTAAAVAARGDAYLERFKGGVEGTRWYYREMFEALKPALPDPMVDDLTARLVTLRA